MSPEGTPVAPAPYETLLAVLGENRNGWMPGFGYASHQIASAVSVGTLTEADLTGFSPYDDQQAQALCRKAGLPWHTDPEVVDPIPYGGLRANLDTEDVSISVAAILGLPLGLIGVEMNPWYLEQEDLDGIPGGEQALQATARSLTVTEAAQAILDSDARFRLRGYRRRS